MSRNNFIDFQIKEDFIINGKKTKIISGALHYFRIIPELWETSLFNLKALGCNTVETYIPWNLHEPKKGTFNFLGLADIEAFIELATSMDLYIILRPSPYICAEWDFGGLPAWLLKDRNLRVRSQDFNFLQHVRDYYQVLLPKLTRYQYTQGGNVLMMQVENEYGSFAEDHQYLREIAKIMKENGVDVPLFTSDGGWSEALNSGALGQDEVLATVNFGSDAKENFKALQDYQTLHDLKHPLMCMEFWDGWFNTWGNEIIRRDAEDTAQAVAEVLELGSINFYMFQGGTNFGFFSGSSIINEKQIPQITSYDYDALLTEWGAPTEKYFAVQKVIEDKCPNVKTLRPKSPKLGSYDSVKLHAKTSLFSNLDSLKKIKNDYTLTMEELDQNFGYVLYETTLHGPRMIEDLRVINANDRLQFYLNNRHLETQWLNQVGEPIGLRLDSKTQTLYILAENLSRINYGPELIAPHQRKGIRGGVMENIHFISDWTHYSLDFSNLKAIDFNKSFIEGTPSFYKFKVNIKSPTSTFIDTRAYGKGCIFINGFNIGRYWSLGPTGYLYVPFSLWKKGENTVIIFETEAIEIVELKFSKQAIYLNE